MVEVVHWNPRSRVIRGHEFGRRRNNFGDLLGPVIVDAICRSRGLEPRSRDDRRLLCVGSVLHFAHDGDTVWGSGVNGKIGAGEYSFDRLDLRAVRGPRTRDWLLARGLAAPEVYGDPALLLPILFPQLRATEKHRELAIVPNLHDAWKFRSHADFVNPQWNWRRVVREITGAEIVVGSSLHGYVIGQAFGIPAALMTSDSEHPFKYLDYVEGTGGSVVQPEASLAAAINSARAVARRREDPLAAWNAQSLLKAFPEDLWCQPVSEAR